MFNWEKVNQTWGIEKLQDRSLVKSKDEIHCINCGEHISDHGIKDGVIIHPTDIINLVTTH